MLYKIFFPTVVFLIYLSFNFNFYQQDSKTHKKHPVVTITGDEPSVRSNTDVTINSDLASKEPVFMYSDSLIQITDVYTGEATLYDLQSNGVPQQCWQYPANPNDIHLVLTWNQTPGIPAVNRRTKYVVSNDRGATWINIGEIPSGASAGFPACYGMNDGRIVIANHSSPTGVSRCHIFVEVAAGTSTFYTCDPGTGQNFCSGPRLITTNNNQVVFGASRSVFDDTLFYTNRLINPSTCTFSGWVGHTEVGNAEQYIFDRGSDGRIGLAFIRNDFNPANLGDVMFKESTDNGLTWTQPVLVYDATPGPEFFGALRGVDLVYQGNVPKVVFDLVKLDDQGGFYPDICSRIMFWSPTVNGGVAFPIADSSNTPCVTLGSLTPDDVFTNICRASIGRSADNGYLYVAYNVARAETFDSINYYDIYTVRSGDSGANWYMRYRVTNGTGPLRDCRYPSVSPTNDHSLYYCINLVYQSDSIPGSHVNGAAASLAKQRFMRICYTIINLNVKQISKQVPTDYRLHQNYPNPFNPVTKIRFEIPYVNPSINVSLRVYDALGREVAELLQNKAVIGGIYEKEWDATPYPSGAYYYRIEAGDYRETKKMVLIK